MTTVRSACIVLLVSASVCMAADTTKPAAAPAGSSNLWISDFEAAKALAAKEGKDLLLDFCGSDWCGWCIRLKKEVFATPDFEAAAPKQFVLVELDFPRDKTKVVAATAAQNEKLAKEFGVQGYPSIFLADAQGRPYAQIGYEPGGPTNYLARLADLKKIRATRDAAWAKAGKAAGVDKGKLLAEGLAALDEDLVATCYSPMVAEIKRLDPADSSGIVKKAEFKARLAELEKALMTSISQKDADLAAVAKQVDAFIEANKPVGEAMQKTMMLKLKCYPPRSVENVDEAIKLLDAIAAVDATTPTGTQALQIKKQAETIKQRLEQIKDKTALPATQPK